MEEPLTGTLSQGRGLEWEEQGWVELPSSFYLLQDANSKV